MFLSNRFRKYADIAVMREQIVEPGVAPQGSCHKCQEKRKKKLVIEDGMLIYSAYIAVLF